MRKCLLPVLIVSLLVGCSPFQGTTVPSINMPLDPQSYTWNPDRSASGPVLVFVSTPRQEVVVYRNGVRIGRAAVSTGRSGHQTPTGVFQILQKEVVHHSSTYDNASMPYMQRLTWDGVALHAGFNPGQPDSHGCVRLPAGFAKELYGVTRAGGTVVISNSTKLPRMTLTDDLGTGGAGGATWHGRPQGGATSIVLSTGSQRVYVYQNGRRVGEAPVEVKGAMRGFKGESVFIYLGNLQWQRVVGGGSPGELRESLRVPAGFRQQVLAAMHPGTTMVITSEPAADRGGRNRELLTAE